MIGRDPGGREVPDSTPDAPASNAREARHLIQVVVLNYGVALWDTVLNLLINPFLRPRRLLDYLLARGRQRSVGMSDPVVPSAAIDDVFPLDDGDGQLVLPPIWTHQAERPTLELVELAALGCAARWREARRIFEFGTYRGTTALFLAANMPDAEIVTVDLPQCSVRHVVGEAYRGRPEASRIRQLYGDSSKIDLGEFSASCDLVFIDASHTREGVLADTKSAGRLLSSRGVILWHDFRLGIYPRPIVHVVRRCVEILRRDGRVVHLEGTSLAAFISGE